MGCLYEAKPLPWSRSDLLGMGIQRVVVKMVRLEAIPKDPYRYRMLRERRVREFQTLLMLAPRKHPQRGAGL